MLERSSLWSRLGHAAAVLLAFQLEMLSPLYGFIALALALIAAGRWTLPPKWWWPLGVFGVWQAVTLAWSPERELGLGDLGLMAPLVLLPTIGAMSGVRLKEPMLWLRTFAWAVVFQWTFVFFISIAQNGWVNYKSFELLSRLDLHYQSLYMVVAVLVFERQFWKQNHAYKWVYALAGIWLLFGIITLSARIHLLLVPALILARSVELAIKDPQQRPKIIRWTGIAMVLSAVIVVSLPGPRNRLIDLRNELRSIEGKVDGKQTNHRVFLWRYGSEVIGEHFWIGTGNGAEDLALHEKLKQCEAPFYKGDEPYFLYEEVYDYHNVFLQSWAEGGIVGFLLMVGLFAWGFLRSNGVVRWAWTAFFLTGMTESLLDRQAGAFLLTFLAFVVQTGYPRTNSR
jgi:O-antigen ligase